MSMLAAYGCTQRPIQSQPQNPIVASPRAQDVDGNNYFTKVGPDGKAVQYASQGPSAEAPVDRERPPHPLAQLSDKELEKKFSKDPVALGSISVGHPASGRLIGGVQMPDGDAWHVVNPKETWGTKETIKFLSRSIQSVYDRFPETKQLPIGDISDHDGGFLRPHRSHQSGRDVDVAYYYVDGARWYTNVTEDNLDFPRTWAFVRSIVMESDINAIFMDIAVQRMLKDYALSIGEDAAWLDAIFGGPLSPLRPLISHEPGHRSHMHLRYYNPVAQETGRRLHAALVREKIIKPSTSYVKYKVQRGDNLLKISKKFKTTIEALKRANQLKSNRIIANKTYKIPRKGGVAKQARKARIPARRLPPSTTRQASGPVKPSHSAPSLQ